MFRFCKTFKEKKQLFRKLSKLLHPDAGGDTELMSILLNTWAELEEEQNSDNLDKRKNADKLYSDSPMFKSVLRMINDIECYAQDVNKGFDTKFIHSVFLKAENNNYISVGQYRAILNIYTKFDVKEALKSGNKK